eukprot:gene17708-9368_t
MVDTTDAVLGRTAFLAMDSGIARPWTEDLFLEEENGKLCSDVICNTFAVKYTNAKLDGLIKFDPDEVAAYPGVFCYIGERRHVHVTGQRKYLDNESENEWSVKFEKSFEERHLQLGEQSLFNKGEVEKKPERPKLVRGEVRGKIRQLQKHSEIGQGFDFSTALPAATSSSDHLSFDFRQRPPASSLCDSSDKELKTSGDVKLRSCTSLLSSNESFPESDITKNLPSKENIENDANDAAVESEMLPMDDELIIAREPQVNLDLYEEDVTSIMLAQLSLNVGLSYVRNPYKFDTWSQAYAADTLIGKRCGYGTGLIVDTSLDIHGGVGYYQGYWMSNCRHGYGSLKLVSGLQYRGYWYVDKPHGFGYLIYPDGSVLKGHFAGGLQQGGFEYLSADGNVELRDYHSGNLIASRRIQAENNCSKHETVACNRSGNEADDTPSRNLPTSGSLSSNGETKVKPKKIRSIEELIEKAEKMIEPATTSNEDECTKLEASSPYTEKDGDAVYQVDYWNAVEHLVHILSSENRFFMKQQLSLVNSCCQEMLFEAQKSLSEITEVEKNDSLIKSLTSVNNETVEMLNTKLDKMVSQSDGVLDLCRSLLDRQDQVDKRISSLDVNVSAINVANADHDRLKKQISELEEKVSKAETKISCQICHEMEKNCVLMPCMHMDACRLCIENIRRRQGGSAKCPICRVTIQGEINLKHI